jgi:hypothetical protein
VTQIVSLAKTKSSPTTKQFAPVNKPFLGFSKLLALAINPLYTLLKFPVSIGI